MKMKIEDDLIPATPFFLQILLRIFFRLLYHSFAWSYDLVAWVVSLGNWNHWVKSVMKIINGDRILELGFGTGHLQSALLENGFQVFGLDKSRQMNRIAYHRLQRSKKNHFKTGPRLVQGDGQKLPFPSNYFDTIVATFPTEYIFREDTLEEMYRALKPNGELIILASAWIIGKSWMAKVMALIFRVTGQAPSIETNFTPFQERLEKHHFDAESLWLENHIARLLIFRGKKR